MPTKSLHSKALIWNRH